MINFNLIWSLSFLATPHWIIFLSLPIWWVHFITELCIITGDIKGCQYDSIFHWLGTADDWRSVDTVNAQGLTMAKLIIHFRDPLCMHPSNERWRYNVMLSLIGWVHIQNDPCSALSILLAKLWQKFYLCWCHSAGIILRMHPGNGWARIQNDPWFCMKYIETQKCQVFPFI